MLLFLKKYKHAKVVKINLVDWIHNASQYSAH